MPWTSKFKGSLNERVLEPIIIIDVGAATGVDFGFPSIGVMTDKSFTSDMAYTRAGAMGAVDIHDRYLLTDLRLSRETLRLQSWDFGPGGFSFGLTSKTDSDSRRWPFQPARGLPVRVRIGFAGYHRSEFQTVAWGIVRNISRQADEWQIECSSMIEAMRAPVNVFTGTARTAAFENVGQTTTLSALWDTDPAVNLPVEDKSIFELEAGQVGVCMIEAVDENNPPWFFQFDGTHTTGTQDYLDRFATDDWFGQDYTEGYAYPSGTKVTALAGFSNAPTPWELFDKLLRNESGDMPGSWNLDMPIELVDRDDIAAMASHPSVAPFAAAGGIRWSPMADAPVVDMLGWITDGLSQLGFFPIMREGRMSLGVIPSREALTSSGPYPIILDEDIANIDGHSLYHNDSPAQYSQFIDIRRFPAAAPPSPLFDFVPPAQINSQPWVANREVSLSNRLPPTAREIVPNLAHPRGTTAANTDTLNFVAAGGLWYGMIAEEIKLTLVGLRWAHLALGDVVGINSLYLYGRAGSYYDERREEGRTGMVTAIETDWMRGRIRLSVSVLPNLFAHT